MVLLMERVGGENCHTVSKSTLHLWGLGGVVAFWSHVGLGGSRDGLIGASPWMGERLGMEGQLSRSLSCWGQMVGEGQMVVGPLWVGDYRGWEEGGHTTDPVQLGLKKCLYN